MALFRKLFYRKPPDGLLEISDRVYVFDCCFTTDAWDSEEYKVYVGGVMGQLRDYYPDASILVFNFREEGAPSQIATALSDYDLTIMDYPRQYEGCPLLPMEVIHHFLRSGESWLSLGHQNVLLMHCERGGWPVLAFMLAALLIYSKQYSGEQKTLDMIYKQAPRELLHFLSPLNPIPSQLRYLQYVSRRNVATQWPPLDRALTLDCIIIRMIPNFDGAGGCRPIFRIYGKEPLSDSSRTPRILFSTPKRSKAVRHYKQAECELVKIDINCNIQGDVVLECINLHDDMEREAMILRVMFNTAFIRSNILMLSRNDVDMVWDSKDQFPKDFRAEVLFSEMDAAASTVPADLSCFEEKEGLPVEAFAKVQEIFNSVDWLVPKSDAAIDMIQQLSTSNNAQEMLDSRPGKKIAHVIPEKHQDEPSSGALGSEDKSSTPLTSAKQSVASPRVDQVGGVREDKAETKAIEYRNDPTSLSQLSPPSVSQPSSSGSATVSIASFHPPLLEKPQHWSTSESMHPFSEEQSASNISKSGQSLLVNLAVTETPSLDGFPKNSIFPPLPEGLGISPSALSTPCPAPEKSVSSTTSPLALVPSPPTLTEKDAVIGIRQSTSSPSSPAPHEPQTPPLKESTTVKVQKSPPPPPPLPKIVFQSWKDNINAKVVPPPPPPPFSPQRIHTAISPTLRPTAIPFKNGNDTEPGPPPPHPTSALGQDQADTLRGDSSPPPPPTPPLKENLPLKSSPPPRLDSGEALRTTNSAPVPPLPYPFVPKSSSMDSMSSIENSPHVPSTPPPAPSAPPPPDPSASPPAPSAPPPPPPKAPSSPSQAPAPPPPPAPSAPPPPPAPSAPPPPPAPSPPPPPRATSAPPPPLPSAPSAPPPPPAPSTGTVQQQSSARGSAGPSPPPPLIPQSIGKGRGPTRALTSRNNQSKKLKPLHWLKLTRAVQGSLWAETQKSGEASKGPEIDISELESLFSAAAPNSSHGGKTNPRASAVNKPEIVQLVDHKRAYNCEIMLSKVKVPMHELMASVLDLEDSALDADQVENLIKFCPTKEEVELLKNYKGEKDKLGKCEQFFLELMKVPRTESKLRVFSFKMQFRSQISDLRNSLDVVNSTAEQIRNSVKLKKVMQTILSLGNALNQGTARGAAVGFRLDSLLKLTETRARNNKMTLMHYLCKVLADKLPELLDFLDDLGNLEPSSKIQLKFLAEEMQAINKGLEKVVQELALAENDEPVSEYFRKALKEFLCFAEGEVRSLASLYSVVGRNVDALILYFGEDPSRCTFEQVVSTLLNFVRLFNKCHEENCKQLEAERKKADKEAANEQQMNASLHKGSVHLINSPVKNVK